MIYFINGWKFHLISELIKRGVQVMTKPMSITSRAILAISLLAIFYTIALILVVLLFSESYIEHALRGAVSLKLTAFCIISGGIILWSIFPRKNRPVDPGIPLNRLQQATLFDLVAEIATQTGQLPPKEIYLTNEINTWVTTRGGVFGIGSKRMMGIGLPLVELLTEDEFKAVLAHEFGHCYSGDTKLGPIIYKTRSAIINTITSLATYSSFLHAPFVWYLKFFLRITHAVSRSQELVADRIAARVFGPNPLIDGLKKISVQGLLYDYYIENEIKPAVANGFIPPIYEGFNHYLSSEYGKKIMEAITDENQFEQVSDPYDTHPTLYERIENLSDLPPRTVSSNTSASRLFYGLDTLKHDLVDFIIRKNYSSVKRIEWQNIGTQIWAKSWREVALRFTSITEGHPVSQLVDLRKAILKNREKISPSDDNVLQKNKRLPVAGNEIGAILACALLDAGWRVVAEPGEKTLFKKGGKDFTPFDYTRKIAAGQISSLEWKILCEEYGFADCPLKT
jgi:Zn-dependent protease with chaperone function